MSSNANTLSSSKTFLTGILPAIMLQNRQSDIGSRKLQVRSLNSPSYNFELTSYNCFSVQPHEKRELRWCGRILGDIARHVLVARILGDIARHVLVVLRHAYAHPPISDGGSEGENFGLCIPMLQTRLHAPRIIFFFESTQLHCPAPSIRDRRGGLQ